MSFSEDVRRFVVKVQAQERRVFVGVVQAVYNSIVFGSPITGAPGQPVDTGFLRASWQVLWGADYAEVVTNCAYAEPIEEGMGRFGPLTLRSQVGGWHSVKLTRLGFERLVAAEVAKAAA